MGTAIFLFLISPTLLLAVIVFAGGFLRATFTNPSRRWECYVAIAIVLVSPLPAHLMAQFREQVRFLFWAPFHQTLLNQSPDKDGLIAEWGSWGWVANGYDAYLVRDIADRISTYDEAKAWRERLGASCNIVWSERVWPKIYVVTTEDCGFW